MINTAVVLVTEFVCVHMLTNGLLLLLLLNSERCYYIILEGSGCSFITDSQERVLAVTKLPLNICEFIDELHLC